jgi:hypothetical protein
VPVTLAGYSPWACHSGYDEPIEVSLGGFPS